MKTRILIVILILIIISTVGGYWFGKRTTNVQLDTGTQSKVTLEYKPITTNGISEEEKREIEDFVRTFEGHKFLKDPDKLLGMFTLPETKEEEDALGFILGNDYARESTNPLSRLFSTQGFNHSVGGHYVRSIKKNGESIIVEVDELRIFYIGLGDVIGYSAKVVNLVFEIEKGDAGYKIKNYYHANTPPNETLKYEGFFAD